MNIYAAAITAHRRDGTGIGVSVITLVARSGNEACSIAVAECERLFNRRDYREHRANVTMVTDEQLRAIGR